MLDAPAPVASARTASRRLAWIFATWGGALIGALLLLAYYMFQPVAYDGLGRLGFLGLLYPPLILLLVALATALGLLAWRKRLLLPAAILGGVALAAGAIVVVPHVAVGSWAADRGVPVDIVAAMLPRLHPTEPGPDKTASYQTTPDGRALLMDVWRPDGGQTAAGLPVIVRIHGGAWIRGSRGELPEWNRWLRQRGYVVFDIDYRLPPEAGWRDEIGDVKCAIGWIAAHAGEFGIDPTRIHLMGNSAGGNLAMLAAYSARDMALPPSCPTSPVEIRGVINLYGPSDLAYTYTRTGSPGFIQPALDRYVGGAAESQQERYRVLSPLSYAASGVPTLTVFGTQDRIIPADQVAALGAALDASGIANEAVVIPATDHAFDANWNSLAAQIARVKIVQFLQQIH